jgi:hypothetical protein
MTFQLESYARLLEALAKRDVRPVGRYAAGDVREPFCVLRHFVDREPVAAARMAKLEHRLGAHGTYYFAWDPKLPHYDRGYPSDRNPGGFPAQQVIEAKLYGHEVGYLHVSPRKGAAEPGERVALLRKLAPVQTAVDLSGNDIAGPGLATPSFGAVAISDAGGSWRTAAGERVGGTAALIAALPDQPRLVLDVRPRLWSEGKGLKGLLQR